MVSMESKKRGTEKMTTQNKVVGKCVKCGWEILLSIAIAIILFAGIAFADIPSWFNSEEYLKANPDVAADGYYGSHPFEHFLSSGYPEQRTWQGDPKPPVAPQPPKPDPPKPDPPKPGPIGPKTHTVWVDKFSGYEKTTKFSSSGDNPEFKRFGAVAFGYWPGSDKRYVYNTKYVNAGKGHVEYHPGLTGRYQIKWYFRKTKNRAKKACNVRLVTSKSTRNLKAVSQYAAKSNYASVIIATVNLAAGDYIVCVPGNTKSISFGKMVFTRQ